MNARLGQTIGCLTLMLLGIALISGGIATGAAVEWQLVDTLVHFARRSSPAIITVPMLIILGVAATAVGAIVIRLPVQDGGDG